VPYPTEKKKKKKNMGKTRALIAAVLWCILCPTDRWQHHI